MAIYRFHIADGSDHTIDEEGVELSSLLAAQTEAAVLAGELLRDRPREFWGVPAWTMTVEDESRLVLFTIHIAASTPSATIHQLRA